MNKHPADESTNGPIAEAVAKEVRAFVEEKFRSCLTEVRTEIQDGKNFLLVSLAIDQSTSIGEALRVLEITSAELGRKIPQRAEDYSWMVNVMLDDEILRSSSGGWKGHPGI